MNRQMISRASLVVALVFYLSSVTHAYRNRTELLTLYARYCGHFKLCDPSAVQFPVPVNFVKKDFNQCPACSCNPRCYATGNCCADLQLSDDFSQKSGSRTCVDSKLVISQCSATDKLKYDIILKEKCENISTVSDDPLTSIPVSSSKVNESYRNIYCARCNNVTDVDVWNIQLQCKEIEDLGHLKSINDIWKLNNTCAGSVKYIPTDLKIVKTCKGQNNVGVVYRTCNETGSWKTLDPDVERACLTTSMPFAFGGATFKNVFCYHCNWPILDTSTRIVHPGIKSRNKSQIIQSERPANVRVAARQRRVIQNKLLQGSQNKGSIFANTASDRLPASIKHNDAPHDSKRFIRALVNPILSKSLMNEPVENTLRASVELSIASETVTRPFNINYSGSELRSSLINLPVVSILSSELAADAGMANSVHPSENSIHEPDLTSGTPSSLGQTLPVTIPANGIKKNPDNVTVSSRDQSIHLETGTMVTPFQDKIYNDRSTSAQLEQLTTPVDEHAEATTYMSRETTTKQGLIEMTTGLHNGRMDKTTQHNSEMGGVKQRKGNSKSNNGIGKVVTTPRIISVDPPPTYSDIMSTGEMTTTRGHIITDKPNKTKNRAARPKGQNHSKRNKDKSNRNNDLIDMTTTASSISFVDIPETSDRLSTTNPSKTNRKKVNPNDKTNKTKNRAARPKGQTNSNRNKDKPNRNNDLIYKTTTASSISSVDIPVMSDRLHTPKPNTTNRKKVKQGRNRPITSANVVPTDRTFTQSDNIPAITPSQKDRRKAKERRNRLQNKTSTVDKTDPLDSKSGPPGLQDKPRLVYSCSLKKKRYSGTDVEFKQLTWACENLISFGYPRYDLNGVKQYKNPFCCMCDSNSKGKNCNPSPPPGGVINNGLRPMMSLPTQPGYRFLFDVSSSVTIPTTDDSSENTCKEGELYDDYKKACRTLVCSPGRVLRSGQCIPILPNGVYLRYSLYNTYVTEGVALDHTTDIAASLDDVIRKKLNSVFPGIIVTSSNVNVTNITSLCNSDATSVAYRHFLETIKHGYLETIPNDMLLISPRIDIVLPPSTERKLAEDTLLNLKNTTIYHTVNGSNLTSTPIADLFRVFKDEFNNNMDTIDKPIGTVDSVDAHASKCITLTSTVVNKYTFPTTQKFDKLLFIDLHPLLSCPQVEFNDSEFVIIDTYRIKLVATGTVVNYTDYLKQDDGHLRICKETYENIINDVKTVAEINVNIVDNAEIALRVLNWVLTVISLLCLAMTFITYCLHAKLQTVPGKNNMCLVGLLFLAQLFLFIGIEDQDDNTTCIIFAMFIHYFWLGAFFSMNVCSLHMFRVFTGSHRFSYTNTERLMCYYVCYIFGTPIFILTAVVISNLIETEGKSLGYGDDICFLNGPMNIGIFFVLPVGVMILLNAFFFIAASCKIYLSPHIHRSAKDSRDFFMYMKLFSLTGISWVLQILESQFDVIYLMYLSVIINGSQGVFIFLAFVCNKRVLNMYKQLPLSVKSFSMRSSALSTRSTSHTTPMPSSKRSSLDDYKPTFSGARPAMYEHKPNLTASISLSPGIPV